MGDSETGDRCSSSTDTISNINDVLNNKEKSVDDDRIDCSNSHYLDKIYEVAVRHVTELAESHLKEDKPHFIARFSEIFKNVIEENVTVKGLPWILNKEKLTTDEKQEQKQETTDALLSRLSKTLEKTAEKRKATPQNCCRIYGLQSKYERQNLKRARIEPSITLPSVSSSSKSSIQDHSKELLAVYKNIELAQQQIAKQEEQLCVVQKQVEFAKHIAKQHDAHSETLYDTGYISE
ncbi:uncharacterized protein LOC129957067 isoform X2 [Argiope bruennichi]|uniref:Uncharacterized protein n=2 Tax=Argiope bruennichi TaxID=94029 RepID=A0A8T0FK17_ARGBR|nr:uncharacterized protein LOC129957067 isoform X2 [Argiope bruennichi]KAF8789869.1 hypothetical protein HNY73_007778 [Argiope bruennichi]